MSKRHRVLFTSLICALAATAAHAAGTVSVEFVEPGKFADARDARHDASDNLRVLGAHIEAAASRHLADGDKLIVQVLDVDLAGELRPSRRLQDVRVLNGGADWPRIKLRYTLESPGRPARNVEQTIIDMGYLQRSAVASREDALPHERRMLDEWFQQQLAARGAR